MKTIPDQILSKLGRDRSFLNNKKQCEHYTYEALSSLLRNSGTRQGCPHLPLLFNIELDLSQCNKAR